MKRNISDLLNEISVDEKEIKVKNPLSAHRIRQRTMNSIGQGRTKPVRWLPRVALIAAVIMAMTLTAFAADTILDNESVGEAFKSFFEKPLSEKQEAVLDKVGTVGGSASADNGATITPLAIMSDDTLLYMKVRIVAPEGTVLPDVTGDGYYQFGSSGTHIEYAAGVPSYRIECPVPLSDDDPNDNQKDFVITVRGGSGTKFVNGVSVQLLFKSLWYHSKNINHMSLHYPMSDCCTKLLEGDYEVSFKISNEEKQLDLSTEGLVLHNEEYNFTTTVDKLIITPLSVTRKYTATTPGDADIFPTGGSVEIVMKDGSSIKVGHYSEYNFGKDEGFLRKSEMEKATGMNLTNLVGVETQFKFDEPLVLEDIDYIVYGCEHIIDVN